MGDDMTALQIKLEQLNTRFDEFRKHYEIALRLQAEEYKRRLDDLNHEAERLRQMQATYLPRETWAINNEKVTKDIEELMKFRAELVGRQVLSNILIPVLVSGVVAWVITLIR